MVTTPEGSISHTTWGEERREVTGTAVLPMPLAPTSARRNWGGRGCPGVPPPPCLLIRPHVPTACPLLPPERRTEKTEEAK